MDIVKSFESLKKQRLDNRIVEGDCQETSINNKVRKRRVSLLGIQSRFNKRYKKEYAELFAQATKEELWALAEKEREENDYFHRPVKDIYKEFEIIKSHCIREIEKQRLKKTS